MADEQQEHDRADRDHERSEEAHWRVAESGAEHEDEPTEDAEEGLEIPAPEREDSVGNLKQAGEPT